MSLLAQKKIAVLKGGPGSEREISMKTAESVAEALRAVDADVTEVDVQGSDFLLPEGTELAFIAIHGTFGEDGTLQAILDKRGIPYTGADAESSRIAFDKILSKEKFVAAGVPTPLSQEVSSTDPSAVTLELPVCVKPPREGSSVGVHIVHDQTQLDAAFIDAAKYGETTLVENFIDGKELTVGVLGDQVFPIVHISPEDGFYDINNKYPWLESKGKTNYFCPAELSDEVTASVQKAALAAHQSLGIDVYSRVDVLLDGQDRPWVLEVNTIPGMTESSLLPKAAAAAGIDFPELCSQIALLSLEAREASS